MLEDAVDIVNGSAKSVDVEHIARNQGQQVHGVDAQYAAQGVAEPKLEACALGRQGLEHLTVDEVGRQHKKEVDPDASKVIEVDAQRVKAGVAAVGEQHKEHGQAAEAVELRLVVGLAVVGEEP